MRSVMDDLVRHPPSLSVRIPADISNDDAGLVERYGRRERHVLGRRGSFRFRPVLLAAGADGEQGVGGDSGHALMRTDDIRYTLCRVPMIYRTVGRCDLSYIIGRQVLLTWFNRNSYTITTLPLCYTAIQIQ